MTRSVTPRTRLGWPAYATAWCAWMYVGFVAALLLLLQQAGDRWWFATLITFGPRWIALVPFPLLAGLSLVFHRRSLWLVLFAVGLGIGPVMGLCVSPRGLSRGGVTGPRVIRVIAYNAGEGGDRNAFLRFAKLAEPDVITIAECSNLKLVPTDLGTDWHSALDGGVQVLSRFPIVRTEPLRSERLQPWNRPALRCEIETPSALIQVVGVHLETPRKGLQKLLFASSGAIAEMDRTTGIRRVESELASRLSLSTPLPAIVAGDFNMPVDSVIYRRYWSSWQNAFSAAGFGFGYSKFASNFGIRIDHILASRAWDVRNVRVGPHLGGDHRPVVADLQLR